LRRARRRKAMSMTSLIDVIFLLLLFFMLSSTFSRYSEIEMTVAQGPGSTQARSDSIRLELLPDQIILQDHNVNISDLGPSIEQLQGVERLQLILTVAPDTTSQRLTDVTVILESLEGLDVMIARQT